MIPRALAALFVAAGLVAGCDAVARGTFEDATEHLPGIGYLHVEGDSTTADHGFEAGFIVDGQRCMHAYRLQAELETDNVLRVAPDGCTLSIGRTHVPGVFSHDAGAPVVIPP